MESCTSCGRPGGQCCVPVDKQKWELANNVLTFNAVKDNEQSHNKTRDTSIFQNGDSFIHKGSSTCEIKNGTFVGQVTIGTSGNITVTSDVLQLGDVVQLKSGGPKMTLDNVDRTRKYCEYDSALCTWYDDNRGEFKQFQFNLTSLKKFGTRSGIEIDNSAWK